MSESRGHQTQGDGSVALSSPPPTRRGDWGVPLPAARRIEGLAVRSIGSGPPVLLVHGLAVHGQYWACVLERLAGRARVIVVDLPGFGASPPAADGQTADSLSDAVAASLRALALDEPVLVVGHSLGALVGLRLAGRHPELVSGVVGFSPPVYSDAGAARARIEASSKLARFVLREAWWSRALCAYVYDQRPWAVRALAHRSLRPPARPRPPRGEATPRWSAARATLVHAILAAEAPQWLATLPVPAWLLVGDQDPICDAVALPAVVEGLSRVHLEVWEGGDHNLPCSAPERSAQVILHALAVTSNPQRH